MEPFGSMQFVNSATNLWPLLTFKHSEEEPVRTWVWYFLSMSGCCLVWSVCAFSNKCWSFFIWILVGLSPKSPIHLYCPPPSTRHVNVCDCKSVCLHKLWQAADHLVRHLFLQSWFSNTFYKKKNCWDVRVEFVCTFSLVRFFLRQVSYLVTTLLIRATGLRV